MTGGIELKFVAVVVPREGEKKTRYHFTAPADKQAILENAEQAANGRDIVSILIKIKRDTEPVIWAGTSKNWFMHYESFIKLALEEVRNSK